MESVFSGTGKSHTKDGTTIAFSDHRGIHSDGGSLAVEATWGPDGGICIEQTRIEGADAPCLDSLRAKRCDTAGATMVSPLPVTKARRANNDGIKRSKKRRHAKKRFNKRVRPKENRRRRS